MNKLLPNQSAVVTSAETRSRREVLKLGGATALTLGALGFFSEVSAQTATYDFYISPTGSDSNPGTLSQPWAITALNTKGSLYSGKTVGLLDGNYGLLNLLGLPAVGTNIGFDTNRITVQGGSATSPTIVRAVNRHAAVIDGQRAAIGSTVNWLYGLMGPSGSYVTFDGIRFQGANYRSITNYAGGGSNFVIKNCYFTDQYYITGANPGANSATVFMETWQSCKVSNCYFEQGGSPSDGNRHAFIQAYQSDDLIVEFCTIIGQASPYTSANGIHFKGNDGSTGSAPGRRMTVRNCYIDTSPVSYATPIRWHGNENTDGDETLHHNVIVASGGVFFYHEGISNTYQIYNNNFVSASGGLDCGVLTSYTGERDALAVNFYNNIISRTTVGSYGDIQYASIASLGTVDYNLFDNSPSMWIVIRGGSSYNGLTAWKGASGKDAHSAEATDPLFVRSGSQASYYKLQSGSPAKTLGAGGTEIGAWAGQVQVGSLFSGSSGPMSPTLNSIA